MDPNEIDKEEFLLPVRPHNPDKPAAPIRTFSTDLAQAVRKDEMSVIKVAMAEEKRRQDEDFELSPGSSKNRAFVAVGTALIILTVIGLGVVYLIKKNRVPDVIPSEVQIPTLITAEASTSVEIGGQGDGKILELTRTATSNVSSTDNSIVNIYFTDSTYSTKQLITANAFLSGIKSEIPQPLLRSLQNNFMLGIYTKDSTRHPFLILKTADFQIAFANMFTWEKKLFSDFYVPFNLTGDEETFVNKFTDLLVENKDTRALKKDDGTISLIYGFADEKTIIIADGVETFKEVLRRLQSMR
ncbi:MAG: hypothetical protein RL641_304 [Candidatus Parcubacteria bacterium]|jgi:hypothetical protein